MVLFCKSTITPNISSRRAEDFVFVESRSRDVMLLENLRFDCATLSAKIFCQINLEKFNRVEDVPCLTAVGNK
jgi:hypothetical protein